MNIVNSDHCSLHVGNHGECLSGAETPAGGFGCGTVIEVWLSTRQFVLINHEFATEHIDPMVTSGRLPPFGMPLPRAVTGFLRQLKHQNA